ncbi:hypothetical protein ASPWEDRAFT_35458 [Aspergillus wentii DTO 134E9]|uniref:Uncharacterized protein n=1 Tax=Aspergillus wentii DTO 134E9 TaxID=1073089 RepID=A0A1L9S3V0_ASPWE|nr:uncharacterized protein ASPWEDRAFT_35458 [Aspergillus wentii DTO 134E9]OJJ41846.1 hypothetical protein ASPWEDRAFT_35458 [Aspergillus wentii DTO 134E9]
MGNPTSTFKPSPSDDAASTYSVSSTATTLKGTELKKKWFSFGPKSNTNTDSKPNTKPISKSESVEDESSKSAVHYEAMATYLALR